MINVKHQKYIVNFDKERVMSFDFNALAEVEALTGGRNIFQIILKFKELQGLTPDKVIENISFSDLRILLYAGLKSENPELTIEEAGKLAGIGSMQEVLSSILNAFNLSMPDKKK